MEVLQHNEQNLLGLEDLAGLNNFQRHCVLNKR